MNLNRVTVTHEFSMCHDSENCQTYSFSNLISYIILL